MNKFSLTLQYKLPDGFMIDIVTLSDTFAAYIYHKDYGTKNLIFAISKDDIDYDSFVSMVNNNMSFSINNYTENIID